VLAWALGRFAIPPHDELVTFNPLWQSLGFLDAEAASALLARPQLRSRKELSALRNRLFALHWRLRNFRLKSEALDLLEFAHSCWFGPLDRTARPLVDGDLAIGGQRLDRIDRGDLATTLSSAQERHHAANWLWEGPQLYSRASVAT